MRVRNVFCLLPFYWLLVAVPVNAELIEQWAYTYGQPYTVEAANDIVVDTSGYIYAVGTDGDFLVIKLNPQNGSQEWLYRYNGPLNGFDEAFSIAIDTLSGCIYAAGYSKGNGTGDDFTVIKLPLTGPPAEWVYRYNGSANGQDWARAIALDGSGYIYAAGHSCESGTDYNFTVIKIPPTGSPEEWVYTCNGFANGYEGAVDIDVDTLGYSYIAGSLLGNGTGSDFTVVKLPPTGPPAAWVYTHNGTGNNNDYATSIALGPSGNVHAAGYTWGSTMDYMVVKLSLVDGSELWPPFTDDPFGGSDYAMDVAVGTEGHIYSTGVVTTMFGADMVIYKLPPSGPPYEWAQVVPTGWGDRGETVVVGLSGIYVGGYLFGDDALGGGLFAVYKWLPDGSWDNGYIYWNEDSCGFAKSIALDIVSSDSEYVYAAGHTYGGNVGGFFVPDFITVKLTSSNIVPVAEMQDLDVTLPFQIKVSPNPFRMKTEIRWQITDRHQMNNDRLELRICDAAGRLVRHWDCPTIRQSNYVVWQGNDDKGRRVPPGVYFAQLHTPEKIITEKIIKME